MAPERPKYRSILSATPKEPPSSDKAASSLNGFRGTRKRASVIADACESCRRCKIRCTGQRPCEGCAKRDVDCIYVPRVRAMNLKGASLDRKGILERLIASSEEEAQEILRRLRASKDATLVLSSVEGSMHGRVRPSDLAATRAAGPPTQSPLEFELMNRHPCAYAATVPVNMEALSTMVSLKPWGLISSGAEEAPPDATMSSDSCQSEEADREHEPELPILTPVPTEYCDSRLQDLHIGYWTSLPIDDGMARSALSHYFTVAHPFFGFFDPDSFLDDMIHQHHEFCSKFLVAAAMAFACQGYAIVDRASYMYGEMFTNEAVTLWREERSKDSILNVAAMMLLSLACSVDHADIPLLEVFEDARLMSTRLKLFNHAQRAEDEALQRETPDQTRQRATSYVAWGAYNWLTLNTFYRAVMPITHPPTLPIPGDMPQNGNSLAQSQPTQKPTHAGEIFPTLCKIWCIMQQVAAVYFGERLGTKNELVKIPLAFAVYKYRVLVAALEDSGRRNKKLLNRTDSRIAPLHMVFHCAVADIFQPFVGESDINATVLPSSHEKSVNTLLHATTNQLKRLVLVYRMETPPQRLLITISSTLIHVGNAVLRDVGKDGNEDWRFYFLMCLAICQDLLASFPICKIIGQGLLTMAMRNGAMSSREAQELMAALSIPSRRYAVKGKAFQNFTIDFDLAATKPEEAQVNEMATKFDEIVIFNDLTQGDDFVVEGDPDNEATRA